jgi:5-hydroxyisourate hydrolase
MVAPVSGISTHILDTSIGRPATSVAITLARSEAGKWIEISSFWTDEDGRVEQLLPQDYLLVPGSYRLSFATGNYFATQNIAGLYPVVEITFLVRDAAAHYHIPLLLTANGYSTYRGS